MLVRLEMLTIYVEGGAKEEEKDFQAAFCRDCPVLWLTGSLYGVYAVAHKVPKDEQKPAYEL